MKKIIILVAIFICFLLIFPVLVQGADIGQSQITPASPLYFLQSIREILELQFVGSTQVKAKLELEFATARIREVKRLVNTTHQDLIEPTLYQYLYHLQEFISLANFKDADFAAQASKNITGQMADLQTVYGQVSDTRALLSIRSIINRLSKLDLKLIDKLNLAGRRLPAEQVSNSRLSACHFLDKVASSSALNEVEKAVFVKRASDCLSGL